MCYFKPHTFIIVPNKTSPIVVSVTEFPSVWHNNESVGFKVAHLKVWGLIFHEDKAIGLFLDFPQYFYFKLRLLL